MTWRKAAGRERVEALQLCVASCLGLVGVICWMWPFDTALFGSGSGPLTVLCSGMSCLSLNGGKAGLGSQAIAMELSQHF
jgi:hypothetical protein